jgi:hypothetical protein
MSENPSDTEAFADLLARLQSLIGESLLIELGRPDIFFGLNLETTLQRIETLPDSDSVIAWFSGGLTIDLAPGEQSLSTEGETLTISVGEHLILDFTRTDAD